MAQEQGNIVTHFYCNGSFLTAKTAEWLIANSFPSGIPAGTWLFWRVGKAQRLAIIQCLWLVSDARECRYEAEHGMAKNGLFVGVPYFLDCTIGDDEIRLEVIDRGTCVGRITGAGRSQEDFRKAQMDAASGDKVGASDGR